MIRKPLNILKIKLMTNLSLAKLIITMNAADTTFDYINLKIKHEINTINSHLCLEEKEMVDCYKLDFN